MKMCNITFLVVWFSASCILFTSAAPSNNLEADDIERDESSGSAELQGTTTSPDCDCVCGVPNKKQRIVGGNETLPNEFPWIVALARRGKFYCGATLVTRKHLVTAAHCLDGFNLKEITAYFGIHRRAEMDRKGAVMRRFQKASIHPKFDLYSFDNDIAVLEMDNEVDLGEKVRPACLPRDNSEDYTGRNAVVAGWGRLGERRETAVALQKVDVPVMSMEACRSSGYGEKRISDNMICAGYPEGKKDGCQGDSGGPMHIPTDGTTELIGVVSWGRGCARARFPGVYTRVANYLDFIDTHLGGECKCPRP